MPAQRGLLFPVRALAQVFRAKYLDGLRRAFEREDLRFAGSVAALAEPAAFRAWLATLRAADWVVTPSRPSGGPRRSWSIWGGTRTGSRSPTTAC